MKERVEVNALNKAVWESLKRIVELERNQDVYGRRLYALQKRVAELERGTRVT